MTLNRETKRKSQSGFTLIELMIAMLILSFISMGIYNATTETFKRRDQTERDGDFYNSIRMALDVIGRDIIAIYTPQEKALPSGFGSGASGGSGQPQSVAQPQDFGSPLPFWGAPINQHNVRPSRFQGEETKMSFVTSSHARIYRDTPESDFAKVTYTLEEPKAPEPGQKGKLLVKHEDTSNIFGEDERATNENEIKYTLIDIVKSISFEYLDGEKDTWSKRWDTEGMDHKGKFPDIIKVTIELYTPGESGSTFTVVQQYRRELVPL